MDFRLGIRCKAPACTTASSNSGKAVHHLCRCCIPMAALRQTKQGLPRTPRQISKFHTAALSLDSQVEEDRQKVFQEISEGVGTSPFSLQYSESSADSSEEQNGENMRSTWGHRMITGGTMLLIATLAAKGVSETETPTEILSAIGAFLFAYYLSDFLTGMFHWSVDNYGDGSTPVFGSQIEAFQGHHQKPWTITQRDFCNNVHKVFKPAAPFTALCLLISPWTPSWFDVGISSATFLTCMSQQFHAWAHMKPSEIPSPVKALQDAGILVSRKAHGAHHKAPFEGNYCIVSGFWNPILDNNGSPKSFFRTLERLVQKLTGAEPRCWYEPDYSWQEAD